MGLVRPGESNLITNLGQSLVNESGARYAWLGERAIRRVRTYADAQPGELIALINAFDVLEIARRDGNAETHLGLGRQTPIHLPLAGHLIRA